MTIGIGDSSWRKAAQVFQPWHGSLPLHAILWLGIDTFGNRTTFFQHPTGRLALASKLWLNTIVGPPITVEPIRRKEPVFSSSDLLEAVEEL